MSKIRVTFNRQLTYAEIETFRADMREVLERDPGNKTTWHFTQDRMKIYLQTPYFDSRYAYSVIAEHVEKSYVNVHPVAVRTFDDNVPEPVERSLPMDMDVWGREVYAALDDTYTASVPSGW